MKGKEPIDVFLTENKMMLTRTPIQEGCHTCSITDTSSVNSNSEAGSITTGGWWCELEREITNSVRQVSHIQQK